MGKEICNLTLSRESGTANQNWGFRIIGGTDQGQTYKVSHSWTFESNSFHMFNSYRVLFTTSNEYIWSPKNTDL